MGGNVMANRQWNGSCEDWLHGDEHWNDEVLDADGDEYAPVDDDELAEILEGVRARTIKAYWLKLQRDYPAIERTKA
jgi:hypothetical protein